MEPRQGLEAIAELVCECVRAEEEKWARVRQAPYFEQWLQIELLARLQKEGPFKVEAFEPPAHTSKPLPRRKGFNPDLLLSSENRGAFWWLELKLANLARVLLDGPQKKARREYVGGDRGIKKLWEALQGISIRDTLSLKTDNRLRWKEHRPDQQLLNLLHRREDLDPLRDAVSGTQQHRVGICVLLVQDEDFTFMFEEALKDQAGPPITLRLFQNLEDRVVGFGGEIQNDTQE